MYVSARRRYFVGRRQHIGGDQTGAEDDMRTVAAALVRTSGSAAASRKVGLGGLEPPTSSLSVKRSNHLSYRPVEQI